MLVLLISSQLNAQDPVFSQFFSTPIQLNPALAGSAVSPRLYLNYRNQWPELSNAYITYAATYDQHFDKANSGLGISILSDVAGDGIYQTNKLSAAYSYDFQFSRDFYLKGGLEAGLAQVGINWDKLVFLDQIDPLRGPTDISGNPFPTDETRPANENAFYVDFAAGVVAFTKDYHFGMSIKHLNAPDESLISNSAVFGIVPLRFTIHAGAEINLNSTNNKILNRAFISPNIMYVRQGEFNQLNLGAYANFGSIYGGTWFRHTFGNSDAVIVLGGYQYKTFKIGYSYDVTVSELAGSTGGAHEISLTMLFDSPRKRRNKQYLNCLKMFR